MKPAREPASSRPRPCASLKKPHDSCPFAAPCAPCRKKNDRGQTSACSLQTSRLTPFILAHRGPALPWLVDDRAALRLSLPNLVRTHPIEHYQALRDSAPCLSRAATLPKARRVPSWSSEEARTWEHHPQPTIPPPRLNRQAES